MSARITALITLLAGLALSGCSTAPIVENPPPQEPAFSAERLLMEDVDTPFVVNDPWEGLNRTMYRFNYRFDRYVFLPAVSAYQTVMPDFAEKGVHNFFTNFRQISTLINSILQFEGVESEENTDRFRLPATHADATPLVFYVTFARRGNSGSLHHARHLHGEHAIEVPGLFF